jgi:hypothetical protein
MTNSDKNKIWQVLTKYDNTLVGLCDSLSNILQQKADSSDYKNVFINYRKMDLEDTKLVDSIIGSKIMSSIN